MLMPELLHSQCDYESDANIIRTNPDNYYNPSDPQALKMWDWRGNTTYSIYLKTSSTTAVSLNLKSPFWADNTFNAQDNVDYLRVSTNKDYQPIDGWELIYKNFGQCCNDINEAVSDPSFALYNKYNSTLRIFVYVASNTEAYNSAVINLTFDYPTNNIHSYNLSENVSKITALDKKIKQITASKVNRFNNGFGYWLHADFPMAYDPCACNHLSIMSLRPMLVATGNLEIEIVGKAKQEVIKTAVSSPSPLDLSAILSIISGGYSAGNAKYKTWNDFRTNTENTIQTQNDDIKSSLQSSFGSFPEWTKMIPEIGRYIGMFEYFTGGGQKDVKAISPTNFDISLKSTSTSNLTFTDPYGATKFYTPGSNYSNNTANFAPVYDEPMGIFNLLETPKLEFYGIVPYPQIFYGVSACLNQVQKNARGEEIDHMNQSFPMIRHYKVKNNLKYVINPRANVEVISIEAQIVFRPNMKIYPSKNGTKNSKMFKGPVEVGQLNNNISYVDRMKNLGLNIDYWPDDKTTNNDDNDIDNIIYSTRLLSGSCFKETAFRVFDINDDEKYIFCKVIIKLRRKDGLGQDILMVKMYNVDISQAQDDDLSRKYYIRSEDGEHLVCDMSKNFVESVSSTPFSNTMVENIPDVITLSNLDFTNDNSPSKTFIAWSKIIIGPNVIFPPGMNVTFQAGQEIITDPNFQSSNNTTFILQLPTPCNTLLNNSNSELSTYCSTTYDPVPISSITAENPTNPKDEKKVEELSINIQAYPNPVDDKLNILIFNNNQYDYSINLVDITGKTVYSTFASKNESIKQIDVKELSSGIYILVVQVGELKKTIKVVIN